MDPSKRTSQACEICHQRKVKCNASEEFPCRNCVTSKVECTIRKHKKRKTKLELENDYFQIGYIKNVTLPIDSVKLDHSVLLPNRNSKFNENLPSGYQVLKDINLFEDGLPGPQDTLEETDLQYLTFIGAFNIPDKTTCDAYIQSCFQKLLFGSILFDQDEFLTTYSDLRKPPSLLLLQAVLFYGALLTPTTHLSQTEKEKHEKTVEILFKRAKALYDIGTESNPIPLCQALLIFRYSTLFSNVNQQYLFWTRTAISTALRFNMDKKVEKNDSLTPYEKKMFKRIWWIIFLRDKYSAFVCGRPCALNFLACEVTNLTDTDLLNENESINELSGERVYTNHVFLSLIKLLKIIDIFVSGSATGNTPHVTATTSSSTSSSSSPAAPDVSFDILRFDQLMKYYLNDINIPHLVKILPNGVTGLVTSYLYVLFLIHRSNLIKQCKENEKRNIKVNDHNSSWGISFIASCLLIQLSEIQIEFEPQSANHSQSSSLIIYTVYSAGITLCMFLLVDDPKIYQVVERQVLNAIKLLKMFESLAEKDSYNIRIYLKILESLLSSKAKQYKLLKIVTGIRAERKDPSSNDPDDLEVESKSTAAGRSIPISSLLCLPPELNEWPSLTRAKLHETAPPLQKGNFQQGSKNGIKKTGKIQKKKQAPTQSKTNLPSIPSTGNNTPGSSTPLSSSSLTPFSETLIKSQGNQVDLELNTASQFTPEELLNQFIKIFHVCSIYFFPHQNGETDAGPETSSIQAGKVKIIDEEYSAWSDLNITESWVPEFDLEFELDSELENSIASRRSSLVTPQNTAQAKFEPKPVDTKIDLNRFSKHYDSDRKEKATLNNNYQGTNNLNINGMEHKSNALDKDFNLSSNLNIDSYNHLKTEMNTPNNAEIANNGMIPVNPIMNPMGVFNVPAPGVNITGGIATQNMAGHNLQMNPQTMTQNLMNTGLMEQQLANPMHQVNPQIPTHIQAHLQSQMANQMMNQMPNQAQMQPQQHQQHSIPPPAHIPNQIPNHQPQINVSGHELLDTYNVANYPADAFNFVDNQDPATVVNDSNNISQMSVANMNMAMNMGLNMSSNLGPNLNNMNNMNVGMPGMAPDMTNRNNLNVMVNQDGFTGSNSRFSEVVNAFTAEFGRLDRGNFGDSIFQL